MSSPYRGAGLGVELRRVRVVRPRLVWPLAALTFVLGALASWYPFSGWHDGHPSFRAQIRFSALGALVAVVSLAVLAATFRLAHRRADLVFCERGFEIVRAGARAPVPVLYRDVTAVALHGVSEGTPSPSGSFTYVLSLSQGEPVMISSLDYDGIDADFGDWLVERTGRPIL